MRILKGSYHSKILQVMSTCKLKINCFILSSLQLKMTNLSDLKGSVLTVIIGYFFVVHSGTTTSPFQFVNKVKSQTESRELGTSQD